MPSSEETAVGAVGIEHPVITAVIARVLTSASFMGDSPVKQLELFKG
jgi:hypothetical protein